jgi:hypothetical protein
MKSISLEQRSVFIVTEADEKKISEAKFKLAGIQFGYGKFDHGYYWSLPFNKCSQGYTILKSLFGNIQQI